jgi:hypothetical protein
VAFRSVPRPSSPPGAKASTECPCFARASAMHRSKPRHRQPAAGTTHPIHAKTPTHTITHSGIPAPPRPNQTPRRRTNPDASEPARTPQPPAKAGNHRSDITHRHAPRDAPKPRFTLTKTTSGTRPVHRPGPHRQTFFPLPRSQPARIPTRSPGTPRGSRQRADGDDRTRTDDPLLAKQALAQLSFVPGPAISFQLSVPRPSDPRPSDPRPSDPRPSDP